MSKDVEFITIEHDLVQQTLIDIGVGRKDDNDKVRYDLIPYDVLDDVAKVYTEGAKKYDDNNWQLVDKAKDRYFAALMRHLIAWKNGEVINERDFGLPHMSHVIWNAMALDWFDKHDRK